MASSSGLQGVGLQGVALQGNTVIPVSVTANAGVANVTVAAYNPTEADAIIPTTAAVTVAANAPVQTVKAAAGHSNVTVAATNGIVPSAAYPTVAAVTAAGNQAIGEVTPTTTGLGNVTAAAYNPSVSTPASVTANPGIAQVQVASYAPSVVTTPHPVAGVAGVTVQAYTVPYVSPVVAGGNGYGTQVYGTVAYGTGGFTAGVSVTVIPGTARATATAGNASVSKASNEIPPEYTGLCTFECPQVRDRAPYLPDSSQAEYNLWRHFENRLRGVNVWQRSDGTFCVDTPANYEAAQTHPAAYFSDDPIGPDLTAEEQGLSDSNVNYPWNPIPPQPPFYDSTISEVPGAYVFITNWDQTTETLALDPYLVKWWQGGAVYTITQEEALVLTAAGFGDDIT